MQESDASDARWESWPLCPGCGQRRQAVCPVCQVAGNAFPLADCIPAAAPLHNASTGEPADSLHNDDCVLLMCESCDEAFAPRFYQVCEHCGHEFADGIRFEEVKPPEIPQRAWIALAALLAIAVGMIAYFAVVLRQ